MKETLAGACSATVFLWTLAQGPGPATAAVLRIPEDYPTIVAAVDAAVSGDSVSVGPGTWTDTSTRLVSIGGIPKTFTSCGFLPGGVTVFGRDGRDATVVDAQESGAGFVTPFVYVSEAEPVTLTGLTITGANVTSDAVFGDTAGRMIITHCRIRDNAGDGVQAFACPVTIEDSEVSFNGPGLSEAAIWVFNADLEMRRCRVEGNRERGVAVIGSSFPVQALITDCEITDNLASVGAGGVNLTNAFGEVSRNVFARNVALAGDGGGLSHCSTITAPMLVEGNTFVENAAVGGGGLFIAGNADVIGNTFFGCTSSAGDAVGFRLGTIGFASNIISACTGSWALLRIAGTFTPISGCNVLWNNQADTIQWPLALTDFNADPLFCDPASGDFTISSASPCAAGNTPGCGQIGAWGPSCGPVSVEDASWGEIKSLYR